MAFYEDNISGKLSDERFQKLSADYEKEEQELKVLASSLRKEMELEESKSADVDRFLSVVERYTDSPELTPCILHEFVEKIIVHAARPQGQEPDAGDRYLLQGHRSLGNVKSHGINGKNEKTVQPKLYRSLFPHDVFLSGVALAGFLFCYFMLSMAFSAKLLSTSASKSTHCAFVSSPASVITVSSRSSAERAIMGAAFHASICR